MKSIASFVLVLLKVVLVLELMVVSWFLLLLLPVIPVLLMASFVARVLGLSADVAAGISAVLSVPFGYYGDTPPEEPEDFDPDAFVDGILAELSDLAGELDA